MATLVQNANSLVESNDADPLKPKILTIDAEMTATSSKRCHVLDNVRFGGTEILRISTPLGVSFSETEMVVFMELVRGSRIWGLNMGEFQATDAAWRVFGEALRDTFVGFVWINERGKDIGASKDVHDWLLGTGKHADRGVLRGKNSVLAANRRKAVQWSPRQPWFDASNPTMKAELSRKFLFNPRNSIHFGGIM